MNPLDLDTWIRHQRLLGVVAIFVGLGAWATEWAGMVYICPFCRAQRTVIVILGVLMLLPSPRHWLVRYLALVIGFFGAVVASYQHFMSWAKISKGEFAWGEQWYIHPFLLSGAALFIIIAQVWFITLSDSTRQAAEPDEAE
ncbi:MAG: disulfide bond formation protein B [Halieaceae bacterium]|jgi:disulfide bond formation protein DsbB|nr:disulfide bond formation protein B [Halieaceae bacterium]